MQMGLVGGRLGGDPVSQPPKNLEIFVEHLAWNIFERFFTSQYVLIKAVQKFFSKILSKFSCS